jgi:hypothetical protein
MGERLTRGPWGQHGSIEMNRYIQPVGPRSRRRCNCGCKQRSTHLGMANGVCLAEGCELSMRRWVRDPLHSIRLRYARKAAALERLP